MSFNFPTLGFAFYVAAFPILILCFGAITAMLQGVFTSIGRPLAVKAVFYATLLLALFGSLNSSAETSTSYLGGSYLAGEIARFGQGLILIIAAAVGVLFGETFLKERFFRGEIISLFLMLVAGMLVMLSSDDLITMFVGLELSSIGLYALVGYVNPSRNSQEGAIKYFVLGAFAAAILLFGIGLLYAGTGTMRISEIVIALPKVADHSWIKLGGLLTLVGLGFKLALAPFHLWAPDVYEAAPTGITAFMATTVKIMILIVVTRIFTGGFNYLYDVWTPGLILLASMSMIVGNIMALVQLSIKRMLAYSSIAHSGYLAIAICALGSASGQLPVAAIMFYVTGYSIISIGTFGILMWLENKNNDNLLLDDIQGLAKKHPWAAFAMAVFMFSFAGMPPTVGFMAKFFVFNAALSGKLYGLVIVGVIGSTISLFYYLRIVVKMYMMDAEKMHPAPEPQRSWVVSSLLVTTILLTLLLGTVLPGKAMQTMMVNTQEIAAK